MLSLVNVSPVWCIYLFDCSKFTDRILYYLSRFLHVLLRLSRTTQFLEIAILIGVRVKQIAELFLQFGRLLSLIESKLLDTLPLKKFEKIFKLSNERAELCYVIDLVNFVLWYFVFSFCLELNNNIEFPDPIREFNALGCTTKSSEIWKGFEKAK